jgi:hypothetical protein
MKKKIFRHILYIFRPKRKEKKEGGKKERKEEGKKERKRKIFCVLVSRSQ